MNVVTSLRGAIVAAFVLGLGACANSGMTPAQRNAAIGAGVGAVAGAAVADDDATGALVGGALGAAAGYYTGCREQGGCYIGGERVESERQYDARASRYYFTDPRTGRTYWENGEPRT